MGTGSDRVWQCAECGRDKEAEAEKCTTCDSYNSVAVQSSAIVHTTYNEVDEQIEPNIAAIRSVNIDNVAAIVTDSPSVRTDVLAIASAVIFLQAFAGIVVFDPRYLVSIVPLYALFGVLLYLRRPNEGVTVQSLSSDHEFASDPTPFVEAFEAASDIVLSYATGWRTWLYVVDREYWIAPEHVDSLTHELDSAPNALLWALLSGAVTGAGAAVGVTQIASRIEAGVAAAGVFALVGVGVWLFLQKTALTDVIEVRTMAGRSFRFPLSQDVATKFLDRYTETLEERDDNWVDIHHERDETERVPIPNVQSVTRWEHTWTTAAYGIAVLGHVLLAGFLWRATGPVDPPTIHRVIATAAPVGVSALLVYVLASRPDQVFVTTDARQRAVPAVEAESVGDEIIDELDSAVHLEHTVESVLTRERRVTSIDPSAVALLDHAETDATWLRQPKLVAAVLLASLVGMIGAYEYGPDGLWQPVAALAVCVSAGVVAWAWTGAEYAKLRFTMTNGDRRAFLLTPADASEVVNRVFESQSYVSRTDERSINGLLKPLDWYRTLTRYVNLSNAGVATPFIPTLNWVRRAVLGALIAGILGGTYVVYTSIAADLLIAGGVLLLGGLVTLFVYGLLLDDPGLRLVTGGGDLRVYEADNDAVVDDFADEHDEVFELSVDSTDQGVWHVAPDEVVSLEQHTPPVYPSLILLALTLLVSVGASVITLQEVAHGLRGYATIIGVFVASVFVVGGLLGQILEWLGLPIFDRLIAELAGEERVQASLDDDVDFSSFEERTRTQGSEASTYRVGATASEVGTPGERFWTRVRGLVGSSGDARPDRRAGDDSPSGDEK